MKNKFKFSCSEIIDYLIHLFPKQNNFNNNCKISYAQKNSW